MQLGRGSGLLMNNTFKIPEDHLYSKINKVLRGRGHIGGGALRSYLEDKPARDIDVFMRSDNTEEFHEVCSDILNEMKYSIAIKYDGYTTVSFSSGFFEEYKPELTVIVPKMIKGRFLFGTPKELVEGFDFTCVAMVLLEDDTILFNNKGKTIWAIEYKQLELQSGIELDARTLKRIEKYKGYGYEFFPEEF